MIDSTPARSEPLNILVFGAADILMRPILKQVENQLPESTKLLVVGNKHDIGLTNLVRMERRIGNIEKILKADKYSGSAIELTSSRKHKISIMTGLDHLERKSKNFVWRHHKIDSISDSKNYYHIVVDLLANYLVEQQINLLLFFEIPHLFSDTLCYQIAKSKGIETLIVSPSNFPDRFFSLRTIEDFGIIGKGIDSHAITPYEIDPDIVPEWIYMMGVKQYRGELGRLNWHGILMLIAHLLAVDPFKLFQIDLLFKTVSRMRKISSAFPKWRYPFKEYFTVRHLDYFEYLLNFENADIDLDSKFVYFPLHLQPELTTSAIGKENSDQLLAIERLSRLLTEDYSIFVKENPKQGGQMRGSQFFQRLNRIGKIRLLPSYVNTYELIDKCQFVATITGTVGWEAICKGKNVLVFGIPWYRDLTGVISFRKGLTLEEITNYKISHETLERQVGRLISRTHLGNIMPLKRRHSSGGYDIESNAELAAESIVQLIQHQTETTFLPMEC